MSKFYVGQKVVDGYGMFGTVMNVTSSSTDKYPVVVEFEGDDNYFFTTRGEFNLDDKKSVRNNIYPLVEGQPTPVKMPEDEENTVTNVKDGDIIYFNFDGKLESGVVENASDCGTLFKLVTSVEKTDDWLFGKTKKTFIVVNLNKKYDNLEILGVKTS